MARVVTVVLDREYGEQLEELIFRTPVWIVESVANRNAAARASVKSQEWPQISVTVFRFPAAPEKDDWVVLLRQLDIAQRRPFTAVVVIGGVADDAMRAAFDEAGFTKVEEADGRVRATRQ